MKKGKYKTVVFCFLLVLLVSYFACSKTAVSAEGQIYSGRYYIFNYATTFVIDCTGYSNPSSAVQYMFHSQSNQQWDIYRYTDGTYTIKNVMSGNYLGITSPGSTSSTLACYSSVSDNSKWYIIENTSGQYSLMAKSNLSYAYVIGSPSPNAQPSSSITNMSYTNNSDYCDEWSFRLIDTDDIYFLGVQASGHNHIYCFGPAVRFMGQQRKYQVFNTGYISTSNCKSLISNSIIFASRSHGGYSGYCSFIVLNSEANTSSLLYADQIYNFISSYAIVDLSNVDLACFIGCQTGYGGATGKNMAVAAVNAGANKAIGFEESIGCSSANTWTEAFFTKKGQGYSVMLSKYYADNTSGLSSLLVS